MTVVHAAHTADLDAASLKAARDLLYDVFDDMTDADWEHSLGGMHALAWDGAELIGHAAVIQRRLLHGGRALRTGYVEGVAVRADRRRQGVASALMAELERIIRGAYDLGALGATDEGAAFYVSRGWTCWTGPTAAMTPNGIERTPDEDGAIYVLTVSSALTGQHAADPAGELACDWRDGDAW
ncbi:aminoglycoside 2'-N-acetyltransferase I [Allocatelliglobosispora scoriae]|uniref:Aminoglycoside 2'-N-acetyltransferase I n=1 Tax=Allocatelliglobosispora scoriae TaxID=643052 RepID=A0A841BQK2_9ACTN|nr:GNAT family N-acetyltransferase [Allocatelliglobosispora scoriae]MBB5869213.1 aminoglycoside 2'-N-acetyltransferase I [Allocatelliglobosispora scoriae]